MESYTEYGHIQIEEVCRICLTKKDQMSLIYEAGLADMLLECASVQVTPENGLFNLVCNHCENEVSRWYVFKQQVVRSFEIGKWLLDRKPKLCEDPPFSSSHQKHLDETPANEKVSMQYPAPSNSIIENVEKLKSLLEEHEPTSKDLQILGSDDKFEVSLCRDLEILPVTSGSKDLQTTRDVNSDNSCTEEIRGTIEEDCQSEAKKKKISENLRCEVCDKRCTSTNSYNRHVKTHDDTRPYVCCKCDKPFKTSQVLSEHMKRHYDDRRHKCELCGQKFYAKASLNDHMRSHTGERPFKCDMCERAFGTKAVLRQHMAVHTMREKKYQCEICSKFLLTPGSLETHKRKHSGIKPFSCSGCDKHFFTKEAMQRHFSAIHDTDNNFLCNVCSKVCSTKVHLNNHMKKKHLGLGRPSNAVCVDCGKQCGSAAELKVHVRVHTGERPYVCDLCDKRFIAKGNLNSHKQRHTGRRPFLCNHCGKAFGEKSTLKVHERIHTGEHPYKCNVCAKAYVQSSALRTHMKAHWKQDPKYSNHH